MTGKSRADWSHLKSLDSANSGTEKPETRVTACGSPEAWRVKDQCTLPADACSVIHASTGVRQTLVASPGWSGHQTAATFNPSQGKCTRHSAVVGPIGPVAMFFCGAYGREHLTRGPRKVRQQRHSSHGCVRGWANLTRGLFFTFAHLRQRFQAYWFKP